MLVLDLVDFFALRIVDNLRVVHRQAVPRFDRFRGRLAGGLYLASCAQAARSADAPATRNDVAITTNQTFREAMRTISFPPAA